MPASPEIFDSSLKTNWAGNLRYQAESVDAPRTIEEIQRMVKQSASLRALGSRHSFNTIADSLTSQISLAHLDSIELDERANTVTVGAGVRYGALAPAIDARGYAVPNLASLPHITVAGAIATATHGSGVHNGNLATAVRGLELVTADGEILRLTQDHEHFHGAVVGLGSLGIVTQVTLAVEPRFEMTQAVYRNLPIGELEQNLEAILGAGYSVSLFTDWQDGNIQQAWIKRRVESAESPKMAPKFHGATAATEKMHPIRGSSAIHCTEQMGEPGPWYERMPHFKMNFTPSSGAELQSEYFVPRDRGYEAIRAVESLKDWIAPHLLVSELRAVAADALWMSMAYRRDSLAIHFTWKPETAEVMGLLPRIEEKLALFEARPHWGKLFAMTPATLAARYEKLDEFRKMLNHYDPLGKFRNGFVNWNVFASQKAG